MVTFEERHNAVVVTLGGSLTAATAESFRNQVNAFLGGHPQTRRVVVNLAGVAFLDSSGLGALIGLLKRVAERGGDVRLAAVQPAVQTVLEITRAHRILPVSTTVEDALGSPAT